MEGIQRSLNVRVKTELVFDKSLLWGLKICGLKITFSKGENEIKETFQDTI